MKGGGDIHAIDKPVLSDLKAGIAHRFQAAIQFHICGGGRGGVGGQYVTF